MSSAKGGGRVGSEAPKGSENQKEESVFARNQSGKNTQSMKLKSGAPKTVRKRCKNQKAIYGLIIVNKKTGKTRKTEKTSLC